MSPTALRLTTDSGKLKQGKTVLLDTGELEREEDCGGWTTVWDVIHDKHLVGHSDEGGKGSIMSTPLTPVYLVLIPDKDRYDDLSPDVPSLSPTVRGRRCSRP